MKRLLFFLVFLSVVLSTQGVEPPYKIGDDGPMSIASIKHPILFVVRKQYIKDHHNTATFFPAAKHEFNTGYFVPGGALKILDPSTGSTTTLLETESGVIRDPDVHFSGRKIVFSMRKDIEDSYHIYEINSDGTGLKQLTSIVDADDFDPIYLPSGKIAFTSTREPKYVMCNRHIAANLYSMDADGANINQIGRSTLFEDHASLMPDGRIMYSRWEYVDRNFGDAQGLWVCNPDGTEHAIYYGNNTSSPGAVLDGRVIPGTQSTVCTFGSCHDRPWGAIAIIDRRLGIDGPDPVLRTWPEGLESWVFVNDDVKNVFDVFKKTPVKYEDPYPLSDPETGIGGRYFLCSRQVSVDHMALYLLDAKGEDIMLYDEGPEKMSCFDPMLLAPRHRPQDVTAKRRYSEEDGSFLVMDVYEGTHMDGIERGDVKYLRVVHVEEKRFWNPGGWVGQGTQAGAMNWDNFENKRILGTVPVEADGSAYFECPSNAFVYFQLLDKNKMMVQSMRSGTIVQPGETQSCIGCHDERSMAPPAYQTNSMPMAALRKPSQLKGWKGESRAFNYLSEVQPVWDAKCISCHDWGGPGAEKLVLAGDKGLFFNASYTELWRKGYTGAIGAGSAVLQQAKAWGSHKSIMMETILSGHQGVKLTAEELEIVATWIDLNGVYYPEFASNYPHSLVGRSPLDNKQLARLQELTGKEFREYRRKEKNPGPMVCFDRPEKSPCLEGLTGETYKEVLAIIRTGKESLEAKPRADMPGFRLENEIDIWRADKYSIRRKQEQRNQAAIAAGIKVYD